MSVRTSELKSFGFSKLVSLLASDSSAKKKGEGFLPLASFRQEKVITDQSKEEPRLILASCVLRGTLCELVLV